MISICIPIFNQDVSKLVNSLSEEIRNNPLQAEIILIDDCSKDEFKTINSVIKSADQYIQLDKNIGRATIRNLFLKYASYNHLLFLDCDSLIIEEHFIANYLKEIEENQKTVFVGGRKYSKKKPDRKHRLRWKYGIKVESKSFEQRSRTPYQSFMTNNFVISRNTLENIKFHENLKNYGHEDTLFGFKLKQNEIDILHIDNPILNGDIEENESFLMQTKKGIANLGIILEELEFNSSFIEDMRLLRTYRQLYLFRPLIRFKFWVAKPILEALFKKGFINLYLFDFYKLGILTEEVELRS